MYKLRDVNSYSDGQPISNYSHERNASSDDSSLHQMKSVVLLSNFISVTFWFGNSTVIRSAIPETICLNSTFRNTRPAIVRWVTSYSISLSKAPTPKLDLLSSRLSSSNSEEEALVEFLRNNRKVRCLTRCFYNSGSWLNITKIKAIYLIKICKRHDLKSLGCKAVRVQVSSRVPRKFSRIIKAIKQCRGRREAVFLCPFFPFRIHFHNIIGPLQQELSQSSYHILPSAMHFCVLI